MPGTRKKPPIGLTYERVPQRVSSPAHSSGSQQPDIPELTRAPEMDRPGSLERSARRFSFPLTNRERELLMSIDDWDRMSSSERPSLEKYLLGGKYKSVIIDRLTRLLLKLPEGERGRLYEIVRLSGLTASFKLPDVLKEWMSGPDGSEYFFTSPRYSLTQAAKRDNVVDRQWFVELHLPAYARAMGDPSLLADIFSKLRTADGLIAPPMQRTGDWPELTDFMERHGVEREHFIDWYSAVNFHDPEFDQHLKIALAARLRPFFEREWMRIKRLDDFKARHPFYEDFLEDISKQTGLGVEDLDAWLSWKYTGSNRKGLGRMLRSHTMMLDRVFAEIRGLKRRPRNEGSLDDVVWQILRKTVNRFASYHSASEKRRKIEVALRGVGVTMESLWHDIEDWRAQGADVTRFELLLERYGFVNPFLTVSSIQSTKIT